VVRVDVRDLDLNEALCVGRRRTQALAQQFRHRLDKLRMQPWEALQFLVRAHMSAAGKVRVREWQQYRARAVMADLDELLVHQLNAAQTRRLEQLDLRLDKEVERDFRHEQARARAGRVADGGADVLVVEVLRWLDASERVSEDVVEDVVYPRTAGELFRGDVDVRAFDGRDKVAGESGHEAED
jgi:hypothetical protein